MLYPNMGGTIARLINHYEVQTRGSWTPDLAVWRFCFYREEPGLRARTLRTGEGRKIFERPTALIEWQALL